MRRLVPCPVCQRHVRATETSCPHCGTSSGAGTFAAIALSAGLALAGCERPPAAVYGPPAVDPVGRTTSTGDANTTTTAAPEMPTVAPVYGPAPVRPEDRMPPTPNPTAAPTTTATAQPTAAPKPTNPSKPEPVNVPMYGPAPRSPDIRVPDKK